jgi:hypothetical protein
VVDLAANLSPAQRLRRDLSRHLWKSRVWQIHAQKGCTHKINLETTYRIEGHGYPPSFLDDDSRMPRSTLTPPASHSQRISKPSRAKQRSIRSRELSELTALSNILASTTPPPSRTHRPRSPGGALDFAPRPPQPKADPAGRQRAPWSEWSRCMLGLSIGASGAGQLTPPRGTNHSQKLGCCVVLMTIGS